MEKFGRGRGRAREGRCLGQPANQKIRDNCSGKGDFGGLKERGEWEDMRWRACAEEGEGEEGWDVVGDERGERISPGRGGKGG